VPPLGLEGALKLECALTPRHFTDYLSLVKAEGRWWIISKVFEVRELPGGVASTAHEGEGSRQARTSATKSGWPSRHHIHHIAPQSLQEA
jgi:hypothetical protein